MGDLLNFDESKKKLIADNESEGDTISFDFIDDNDIMSVFMSTMILLREMSLSSVVNIKIADDQLIIEVKNFMESNTLEFSENATSLTKTGAMYLTDDDGVILEEDELVQSLQELLSNLSLKFVESSDE